MGRYSFPHQDAIQPTKIQRASFSCVYSKMSTVQWYTLLDVSSGKGIINRISGVYGYVSGAPIYLPAEVEIIIDGYVLDIPAPTDGWERIASQGSASNTGNNSVCNVGQIYFNKSCKVRIAVLADATAGSVAGVVDYVLV